MCEIKCRGNRLDVRWRPALVENRERTQKAPRARKWRRDPERLRDGRDVAPNLCLSREKWISAGGGPQPRRLYSDVFRVRGENRPPGHRQGHSRQVLRPAGRARYPSQYRPIPSIAAPSQRKSLATDGPLASEEFPTTTIFSGRSRTAVAAFALSLGAALSLAGQALADPKVLAKVDGQPITDEDVADAMVDIGPGLPQKLEGAARQKYVLDYLVDLRLAAKKAEADKLTTSPEFERKLSYYRQKLAMEQLLSSVGKAATTEAAERKAYDDAAKAEPPSRKSTRGTFLLPTEEEAKKALARSQGRRRLRESRDRTLQGSVRQWRRSRLVHQGPHGAGILRRRFQAEGRRDLRAGEDAVRVARHQDRGRAHQELSPFEQVKDRAARYVSQKAEQVAILQLHNAAKIELFDADGKPLPQAAGGSGRSWARCAARRRRQAEDALTSG